MRVRPEDLIVSVMSNRHSDWSFGLGRAQFVDGTLTRVWASMPICLYKELTPRTEASALLRATMQRDLDLSKLGASEIARRRTEDERGVLSPAERRRRRRIRRDARAARRAARKNEEP